MPWVDFGTALHCAFGTMAALMARKATGKGQWVEGALLRTAVTFGNALLIEQAVIAPNRVPTGNRGQTAAPVDIFRTKDGWILAQVIGEPLFKRWAKLMGEDALADRSALQGRHLARRQRRGHQRAHEPLVRRAHHRRGAGDPGQGQDSRRGPCSSRSRRWTIPTSRPWASSSRPSIPGAPKPAPIAKAPVWLSGTPGSIRRRAPTLGEHTDQILTELGYDKKAIAGLRARRCGVMSSRHLLPGSIMQLAPAVADGWIPGTSPGMTTRRSLGPRHNSRGRSMPEADKEGERYQADRPQAAPGFFLKGSHQLDWGMKNRLARIFNPATGRTVMLAVDHGYFQGPTTGLERIDLSIVPLLPQCDALICTRGILRSLIPAESQKPMVLRASGGPSILREELSNEQIAMDMDDAVRLNAAGVGIQVFIGGEHETRSVHNMTRLVDAGLRVGMPVMGITAVGKDMVRDAKYFRLACRISAELGAQYVKTYYVEKDFETVTASCPVPIVMAGGKKLPELEALTMAYNAVQPRRVRRRHGPQHLPVRRAQGHDRRGQRGRAQERQARRGAGPVQIAEEQRIEVARRLSTRALRHPMFSP